VARDLRQWASCCHSRDRCQCGCSWQPAGVLAQPIGRRPGGRSDGLGAAVPAQPRRQSLAAGGGGGAAHRPSLGSAGGAGVGGPARPGRPRQPGQPRPLGDRPQRRIRDRLQAVSRPPPTRPIRTAVAWPLPPHRRPAGGVLRGRPSRPGPADPQVVVPIVAVHGAQVPWGKVVTQGVPIVSARRLPSMLRALPAVLGPNGSPPWPTKLGSASGLPLDSRHLTPRDSSSRGGNGRLVERLTAFDQRRLRRIALLGRLRVERRANGEASSVMAGLRSVALACRADHRGPD